MVKENEYTTINPEDLKFIESELDKISHPLSLGELAEKMAFKKTSRQLRQEVKIYDPNCKYEIGDLIYKEYNEPLMVSSKGAEHFLGSVVLKVVNKIDYESFNCEMLEVDYSGGGIFRKHIDYMRKTKTQILLPSNCNSKSLPPPVLEKKEDPRLNQLPMTSKDLKRLEKNLKIELTKSENFFNWNELWQLKKKQINTSETKIKKIQKTLSESKTSASTQELVSKFFDIKPGAEEYELHCLSLNNALDKKRRKAFVYVSPNDGGRWILKECLDDFWKGIPLAAPRAKIPSFDIPQKADIQKSPGFPLRIYLSWREILSGGLKIPKKLNRELSLAREFTFTSEEDGKSYPVFYYPSAHVFLGLKEFYESNNVSQGSSLTLDRKDDTRFQFWLKKSKKKLSVPKVSYNTKKDQFSLCDEEMFTFAHPNKIIYLEPDSLKTLTSLYDQQKDKNLRELLVIVFEHFGLEGEMLSLHFLRAFHIVDMLKQTTQEDVEKTMINSPEFTRSEKKKGLFFYPKKTKTEEELKAEEPKKDLEKHLEESPRTRPGKTDEDELEIGSIGEIEIPEIQPLQQEIIEKEPEKAEETIKKEIKIPDEFEEIKKSEEPRIETEAKPSKPSKKKREAIPFDGEKVSRRRKGAKKVIEEKIELEESEMEALIALKSKEKREAEKEDKEKTTEKEEEYKPFVADQPQFGGIFGEKLKSALSQKEKKSKGKKK